MHATRGGKCIGNLVYKSEPRAYVDHYVGRCGDVSYCIEVACTWADTGRSDLKASELGSVSAEHELVWVKGDAVTSTDVVAINHFVEAISQGAFPEKGVADDFCHVRHVWYDLVKAPGVPITRCMYPLWCSFVPVASAGVYKCGELAVVSARGTLW